MSEKQNPPLRPHSKTRQNLREQLMREHIDRKSEERIAGIKSLYEVELLPCPFCGGKAQMFNAQKPFERRRRAFVACLVCGVEMPRIARSREQAAEVWNRRADDATPWPKENPHVIALRIEHQPSKAVDSDPPNCGSSVQKPKESDGEERFFSPEEVRAMSRTEVRKNYEAIIQSMSKWH